MTEQSVQLPPGVTEPDWDSEDFDSWGDEADWHPSWFPKAKAALIRHFSHVDVRVAYVGGGKFSVKLPGSGAREVRQDYLQEFLDGFLRGCELMAEQWDCCERPEEVQS